MGKLLASAARRSVIPAQEILDQLEPGPRGKFIGVAEDLFVNVVVLSDGGENKVVHIATDLMMNLDEMFGKKVCEKYGVKPECIVCGCTHNHSMFAIPAIQDKDDPDYGKGPQPLGEGMGKFVEFVHAQAMEAVDEAFATLRPAKLGAGKGFSGISAKREWATPAATMQSGNRNGYSDHEVAIVRVDELDGKPIALIISNCTHGDFMIWCRNNYPYIHSEVTGSIARYVQKMIGNDIIVSWGMGGGGDQDPFIKGSMSWPTVDENGNFGVGVGVLDGDSALTLMKQLAAMQGLEIYNIYQGIKEFTKELNVKAAMVSREIPRRVPLVRKGVAWYRENNSSLPGLLDESLKELMPNPVKLRFALVNLGGVAFATWNCEPYASIARYAKDIISEVAGCDITLTYDLNRGHEGYLPDVPGDRYYGFAALNTSSYDAYETEKAFRSAYYELAEICKN